jgi:cytochrome c oxidase cbb3-type subunit 1
MGWALPIAFAELLLYFRNLPCLREGRLGLAERVTPSDLLPGGAVPSAISTWMIWVWNLAILVVGVGFFYQDQAWSAYLFGPGYTVLVLLWLYLLIQAFRVRRSLRNRAEGTAEANP